MVLQNGNASNINEMNIGNSNEYEPKKRIVKNRIKRGHKILRRIIKEIYVDDNLIKKKGIKNTEGEKEGREEVEAEKNIKINKIFFIC